MNLRLAVQGLPGGPVVKNPPCSAGDTASVPDLGPTRHGATKPVRHNFQTHVPQPPKPACSRAPAPQQGEAHVKQRRPCTAKN